MPRLGPVQRSSSPGPRGRRRPVRGVLGRQPGRSRLQLGDYEEARARYEEALAITREVGDRRHESFWVGGLGEVASNMGDHRRGPGPVQQALAITRKLGDRYHEQNWVANLGRVAFDIGDYPEAQARYQEALTIARQLGKRDEQPPRGVRRAPGPPRPLPRSRRPAGGGRRPGERAQHVRVASDQARYDATLSACRARLGPGPWRRPPNAAVPWPGNGRWGRPWRCCLECPSEGNTAKWLGIAGPWQASRLHAVTPRKLGLVGLARAGRSWVVPHHTQCGCPGQGLGGPEGAVNCL